MKSSADDADFAERGKHAPDRTPTTAANQQLRQELDHEGHEVHEGKKRNLNDGCFLSFLSSLRELRVLRGAHSCLTEPQPPQPTSSGLCCGLTSGIATSAAFSGVTTAPDETSDVLGAATSFAIGFPSLFGAGLPTSPKLPTAGLPFFRSVFVAEVVRLRSGSTCGGIFPGALRCPTRARHNLDH